MKKLLLFILVFTSVVVGDRAEAKVSRLQNLFVFGDSLSDTGNSRIVTKNYGQTNNLQPGYPLFWPPDPPYSMGRSTNGLVAPEYLWQAFNPGSQGPVASVVGGTNYAINGSTTGLENFNSISPGVLTDFHPAYNKLGAAWQLQEFAKRQPSFSPDSSLFMVWLFPNDLLYWFNSPLKTPGTVTGGEGKVDDVSGLIVNGISNIAGTVGTLASFGATQFLVPNMPDLSRTPLFLDLPKQQRDDISNITDGFNDGLELTLNQLENSLKLENPLTEIITFDTESLFDTVLDDPSAYGFNNVEDPCFTRVETVVFVCDAPDSSFFWDDFHPTTAAHQLFGQRFAAAVASPVPGPLSVLGVTTAFAWSRRLRRRLRPKR